MTELIKQDYLCEDSIMINDTIVATVKAYGHGDSSITPVSVTILFHNVDTYESNTTVFEQKFKEFMNTAMTAIKTAPVSQDEIRTMIRKEY